MEDKPTEIEASSFKEIDIEYLLETVVQPCGIWQWMVTLLLMISSTSIATFSVYANAASSHRCQMEPVIEELIALNNLSFTHVASLIGPWKTSPGAFLSVAPQNFGCYRYKLQWTVETITDLLTGKFNISEPNVELEKCPLGYTYDNSPFHYPQTVVAEFETVCDKAWLVPTGTSLFLFGLVLGLFVGGWIGDRLGRKKTIIIFSLIELVSGIWTTFSPNYTSYVTTRTIMGIGNMGKANAANVLILELTTPKYRSLMSATFNVGSTFCYRSLLALWAYCIPNWRWLHLTMMAPILFTVFYIPCLPESPRWLLACRKKRQAVDVLKVGYRVNKLLKPKQQLSVFSIYEAKITEEPEEITVSIFKSFCWFSKTLSSKFCGRFWIPKPCSSIKLVKISFCCMVIHDGVSTTFFGLLFYARSVFDYVYLTGFLNAAMALPGILLSALVYRFFYRRKYPLLVVMGLTVIILLISAGYTVISKPEDDIVIRVCSNIALILVTAMIGMCHVYIPELFAPELRTEGVGMVSGLGRMFSMTCTFINELDRLTIHGVPLLIYAGMLLFSVLALSFLDEAQRPAKTLCSMDPDLQPQSVSIESIEPENRMSEPAASCKTHRIPQTEVTFQACDTMVNRN